MVYSPDVPVMRTDEGAPIAPWPCSFVTAPAPNAGVARKNAALESGRAADVEAVIGSTLAARAERVLGIAARNGHDTIVLGAWGCGVFKNRPQDVAAVWHTLLRTRFAGCFAHVTFAIRGGGEETVAPFEELFGAVAPISAAGPRSAEHVEEELT